MKRCKSDELQQQQGEEDGAGMEDAACLLPGADLRHGEASSANSIKRGASLHSSGGSGGRRAKSSSLEPQRGSPHLLRKAPQDSSLAAILHQHQGRPRSSSTTDTALLLADGSSAYLLAEEAESIGDKGDKGDLVALSLPSGPGHGDSDGPISLDVPERGGSPALGPEGRLGTATGSSASPPPASPST